MLRKIAEGVLIHESEFMQSNAVVVQGDDGVLLVDPGVHVDEMTCLAKDIGDLGQPVVAAFSTHPHWDHLLWHDQLGTAPRYGTASCVATVQQRLPDAEAKKRIAPMVPPDIFQQMSLELLGLITSLPAQTLHIPWQGPSVRIFEHQAHASGHAALLIENSGVLIAGDMLSDVLIPMLNLNGASAPVDDYLAALSLLEGLASDINVFVPGHGSIGDADQFRARIAQDRAYVLAVRDGGDVDDSRLEPTAYGGDFLPSLHERQLQL